MSEFSIEEVDNVFNQISSTNSKESRLWLSDVEYIEVKYIQPGPYQTRKIFDESALNGLAESIKNNGILVPIAVQKLQNGNYEIIAGERRWRATKLAGLTTIPCVVTRMSKESCMAFNLLENIQRESLNPIEEANAYRKLQNDYGLKHEEISSRIGKPRSTISNSLRLLSLPTLAQEYLETGIISVGHAKLLLKESAPRILQILPLFHQRNITVQDLHKIISKKQLTIESTEDESFLNQRICQDVSDFLYMIFQTRANIKKQKNGIKVTMSFNSLEELNNQCNNIYTKDQDN